MTPTPPAPLPPRCAFIYEHGGEHFSVLPGENLGAPLDWEHERKSPKALTRREVVGACVAMAWLDEAEQRNARMYATDDEDENITLYELAEEAYAHAAAWRRWSRQAEAKSKEE